MGRVVVGLLAALALFTASVLADTWVWSDPTGYLPQPRFEHTANRVGNRLFVVGGALTAQPRRADVHVLSMDTLRWTTPELKGAVPGPTMGHTTLPYENKLLVLFGTNGHITTNRVYELDVDTLEFTRLVPHGRVPTPRAYHSSAMVDGQAFVFGGFDGRGYLNDLHTWRPFDPATNDTGLWVKEKQTGDIPEVRASAATAVYGRRMYLFGGFEVTIYQNDFFYLNLDTLAWTRIHLALDSPCGMPSARAMASLTLVGTKLVLFGGIYCASNGDCTELNDVHRFDIYNSHMMSVPASGTVPPARYGHTGSLFGSKVLVFGGVAWPNMYNDMFMFDVYDNKWTISEGYPPYSRKHHSLDLFHGADDKPTLVMFGGRHGSGGYSQHVHLFDIATSTWRHPAASGPAPPPVGHHASIVQDNSTLIVLGGYNGTHSNNNAHAYDLASNAWQELPVEGQAPPPCHGHAVAAVQGSRWLQFGGVDCVGDVCRFFNDVHALSQDSLAWSQVETVGTSPSPRASHSFTAISPTTVVLFGGIGANFTNKNDVFVYDAALDMWQEVVMAGDGSKPAPRFGHTAAVHDGALVVFGGASCSDINQCDYFDDVFVLDAVRGRWSVLDVRGDLPAARVGAASVSHLRTLYTFGGAAKDRMFSDLFTVQPADVQPDRTLVFGEGATSGVAGKNVRFFLQLQDVFLNNRTSGGDDVAARLTPLSRLQAARLTGRTLEVLVEDMRDGQYKVEFTTDVSGAYNITLSVNDVQLAPFATTIAADIPSPDTTMARGPGLSLCTAGDSCGFDVHLADAHDNRLDHASPLDVAFDGPARVAKRLDDNAAGVVAVHYTPTKVGVYKVHVRVRTVDIKNSPFVLNVTHGAPAAANAVVTGAALKRAVAGDLNSIDVVLFDAHNNPVLVGGDAVKAMLDGPDELECFVTDHNNGSHRIQYTAVKTGEYKLTIQVNGQLVPGSPFVVTIATAPISPATTFAFGGGVRRGVAGYRSRFTVQAADAFGNNITTGGARLNVLLAGPGDTNQQCDVQDLGNGRYAVSYMTTVAGDFVLSATLWTGDAFQSIHLSPFMGVVVAAGADPNKSFLYARDPATPATSDTASFRVVMGVHNYLTIQGVDRYGNKKTTGGDHFTIQLDGPVAHTGFVSDRGDGTYIATYVAPVAGSYHLRVFYGDVPLSGTPILVTARSNFDVCPNACSGHGMCIENECQCVVGFSGKDCSTEVGSCPSNCLGNGVCINGTCFCFPGFRGDACHERVATCPNDCSKHGECVDGVCMCLEGWRGLDCSDNSNTCPSGCSGNGECVNATCLCYPGFKGEDCAQKGVFCPKGCSGKGKCLSGGLCSCFSGWTGLDCAEDEALAQRAATTLPKTKGSSPLQPVAAQEELPARLKRKL